MPPPLAAVLHVSDLGEGGAGDAEHAVVGFQWLAQGILWISEVFPLVERRDWKWVLEGDAQNVPQADRIWDQGLEGGVSGGLSRLVDAVEGYVLTSKGTPMAAVLV